MPIFFHGLDILRVNGYIIYSQTSADQNIEAKDILGQKGFLKELIHSLIVRAGQAELAEKDEANDSIRNILNPKQTARKLTAKVDRRKSRTFTLSKDNPTLKQWDDLKKTCPRQMEKGKQAPCRYCSYLNFVDQKNGVPNPHKVGRTYWMCPHCQVPLCKGRCFDSFHNW